MIRVHEPEMEEVFDAYRVHHPPVKPPLWPRVLKQEANATASVMAEVADEQDRLGAGETNGLGISSDYATNIKEARDAAEGGNKFQQALAAWRTLDLTKLVPSLDTTASELVE